MASRKLTSTTTNNVQLTPNKLTIKEEPLHSMDKVMLFDFTDMRNVDDWREMSDTVESEGKSKAVLTLQRSQLFQRVVLFTLLNPQPNFATFAGVRRLANLDLAKFRYIQITCRGQGQNSHYRISLRHRGLNSDKDPSYEQPFTVSVSNKDFSTVTLPLKDFKPCERGRVIPDGKPLDAGNITMFEFLIREIEFQNYGGVYLPVNQYGVSALEIETVTVS